MLDQSSSLGDILSGDGMTDWAAPDNITIIIKEEILWCHQARLRLWGREVYYSNGRCQTRNDQTLLLRTDSPWSDGSLASPQDCYIITATARYLPSQQAPHSFK